MKIFHSFQPVPGVCSMLLLMFFCFCFKQNQLLKRIMDNEQNSGGFPVLVISGAYFLFTRLDKHQSKMDPPLSNSLGHFKRNSNNHYNIITTTTTIISKNQFKHYLSQRQIGQTISSTILSVILLLDCTLLTISGW